MPVKAIAVIPARGGSKRFPRKNLVPFRGRPIISYTIEAAIQTLLFKKVVVSTEDNEIAKVAEQFGADIHQRSTELATDTARVVDVCLNILREELSRGKNYDILCCLYATAPLRKAEDIVRVVELVKEGECEFAMAVTTYYFPPHQALKTNDSGFLEPMWPEIVNFQSQAVPKMVIDNGSTYAVSTRPFLETGSFYGSKLKGYIMPRERSVDIDEEADLELAELYAGKGLQ
jgi:N-acylneuraminate cytidylyltransferase